MRGGRLRGARATALAGVAGSLVGTLVAALVATGAAAQGADPLPAGQIIDGVAPVGPSNTRIDPVDGLPLVVHRPDPVQTRQPVLRPNVEGPAADFLRRRASRGWAAGMSGFVYDNRDRGHSTLQMHRMPQLAATQYAPVYRERGLDYGVAGALRFEMPVIGNSSTALTRGPFARSQARIAANGQAAAMRAFRLHETNHFYVYPEHRDHDPGTGDRFPANAPFLMVSQGSSGSDRPIVEAAALTLAALRPDTFAAAREAGLIAPTLQMLLRQNRPQAVAAEDYMTGPAHPTAFPGASFDTAALVRAANALMPGDLPPLVRLRVVRDFAARPGIDYPDPAASERLFTTPVAVARAWRSHAHSREIVLDAGDTVDPNGRALEFDWVVLRGDPGKIAITHAEDDPARVRARIAIDWHDAYPVPGRNDLETARIDIGVFARNGATISAPSILSVVFPVHQARRYAPGPGGRMRLAEVSYRRPDRGTGFGGGYVDPALWATGDWTDSYDWPEGGGFATVTRRYADGSARQLQEGLRGLTDAATGAPVIHARGTDGRDRPVLRDDRVAGP